MNLLNKAPRTLFSFKKYFTGMAKLYIYIVLVNIVFYVKYSHSGNISNIHFNEFDSYNCISIHFRGDN